VQHSIDFHRCHCGPLKGRQQYAAESITQCDTETPLKRLGYYSCAAAWITLWLDFELAGLDQGLPVILHEIYRPLTGCEVSKLRG
jgi:hypothetical protein